MEGYIKLYRKLLESPIFQNEKALKVWIWCLCKATHTDHEEIVGRQIVSLKVGQFVFGRLKASEELKMNDRTVYDYMKLLEKMGNVSIKSNNKFSIVTVLEYRNKVQNPRGSKQYGAGYHNGSKDKEIEMLREKIKELEGDTN
jgi:hypothetical protein